MELPNDVVIDILSRRQNANARRQNARRQNANARRQNARPQNAQRQNARRTPARRTPAERPLTMELPNNVVIDILSRLPLEKLGKVRALSKYHFEASHHSSYKELVAQHHLGPILDGFLYQDLCDHHYISSFISPPRPNSPPFDFSLSFLPGHRPRILAAAGNGLVLVETQSGLHKREKIYFICKPSTKQSEKLPSPRRCTTRYFTQSMSLFILRSNPLHFKILRLGIHRPFTYFIWELFDSKSWCWEMLNDPIGVYSFVVPVLASGCAHWIVSVEKSIVAFDFYSETWSRIPMPEIIVAEYDEDTQGCEGWTIELFEYKGKLGLMRNYYHKRCDKPSFVDKPWRTEVWIMDNYSNRSWTRRNDGWLSQPTTFYGSDMSVEWSFDEVIFSSLETGSCTFIKLEKPSHHKTPKMVLPFLSDFEPWNFHPPKHVEAYLE